MVDAQQLLDELVQAARRLGVEVRSEPFETPAAMGGGLCIVRGAHLVLIDLRAPLVDRLRALARALGDLGSEAVYMAPGGAGAGRPVAPRFDSPLGRFLPGEVSKRRDEHPEALDLLHPRQLDGELRGRTAAEQRADEGESPADDASAGVQRLRAHPHIDHVTRALVGQRPREDEGRGLVGLRLEGEAKLLGGAGPAREQHEGRRQDDREGTP